MNRIKELRKKNKWSQKRLGDKLNLSLAAISQYELGKRQIPDDIKEKLCTIFGCSLDYLMCRTEEINKLDALSILKLPLLSNFELLLLLHEQEIKDTKQIVPYINKDNGIYYAYRNNDDSLSPIINRNDIVIIKKTNDIYENEIVAVNINNQILLRKIKIHQNSVILYSNHFEIAPIVTTKDEIVIIGIVIETRKILHLE